MNILAVSKILFLYSKLTFLFQWKMTHFVIFKCIIQHKSYVEIKLRFLVYEYKSGVIKPQECPLLFRESILEASQFTAFIQKSIFL